MTTVSKELVLLYIQGKCSSQDEAMVEEWLLQNDYNAGLALEWIEEMPDEDEKLVIKLSLAKNEIWNSTVEKLSEGNRDFVPEKESFVKVFARSGWLRAAAVLTGFLLIAFAFLFYNKNGQVVIATKNDEVRTVFLPDSSKIILNRNTTVSYAQNWDDGLREVWLKGEGFFEVRHLKSNSRFVVHLSNDKMIEVLGTEFNVSERSANSYIVLKTGKIKLNLKEGSDSSDIYLKPGDLVKVTRGRDDENAVTRSEIHPETYYGWIYGKWILEGTTLREMLSKLKEDYDIEVQVESNVQLDRPVSGSIPLISADTDVLIGDIADLFELKVIRKDNAVVLAERTVN